MSVYFDDYLGYVAGTAPEMFSPWRPVAVRHTWTPVPWRWSIWALIVCMLLMIFFWWPTSEIPKLITSLGDRTTHLSMHLTTVRGETSEIYSLRFFIIVSKGYKKANLDNIYIYIYILLFNISIQQFKDNVAKKHDLKFFFLWQVCLKRYLKVFMEVWKVWVTSQGYDTV